MNPHVFKALCETVDALSTTVQEQARTIARLESEGRKKFEDFAKLEVLLIEIEARVEAVEKNAVKIKTVKSLARAAVRTIMLKWQCRFTCMVVTRRAVWTVQAQAAVAASGGVVPESPARTSSVDAAAANSVLRLLNSLRFASLSHAFNLLPGSKCISRSITHFQYIDRAS